MNSAAIKLDMLERLAGIKDDAVIKRVAAMLRKSFPEVMAGNGAEGNDISDKEYAAFEEMRAKRLRGGDIEGLLGAYPSHMAGTWRSSRLGGKRHRMHTKEDAMARTRP